MPEGRSVLWGNTDHPRADERGFDFHRKRPVDSKCRIRVTSPSRHSERDANFIFSSRRCGPQAQVCRPPSLIRSISSCVESLAA